MALADVANEFLAARAPWTLAKQGRADPAKADEAYRVYSQGIHMFRVLMALVAPIIPATAARAASFLGVEALDWSQATAAPDARSVKPYEALLTRVEPKAVAAMIEASRETTAAAAPAAGSDGDSADDESPYISIDDFMAVDLRVAKIIACEAVEGADKLLALTLDIGDETRNVFSGIKASYRPEDLVGRQTVMVANLAPRKMRFGVSEGMVLAASDGSGIFLVGVDDGAAPGLRVR